MLKKTPLYQEHLALDAKMVPFADYDMPVEYKEGLVAEHRAVRNFAGLFDVSHMGEFEIRGKDVVKWLNKVFTNAFDSLKPGRVRYTVLCNEKGFCLDDLIVYCFNPEHYLLVVNAANREKDKKWLTAHLEGDVRFSDVSEDCALLALQGPATETLMQNLLTAGKLPGGYYRFSQDTALCGEDCLIARTGYTGEHGYEIFLRPESAVKIWREILKYEDEDGRKVMPCGLGARDTLRLEAGMPLYGHEMSESISPLEAGLDFAVKMQKDFIGRDALKGETKRERIGLKVTGRGIVRENCPVFFNGEKIGETSSGTYAPYLEEAVAMALVEKGKVKPGDPLEAQVRKRLIPMEVVPLPFYKAKKS